ncbi:hypothetical protein EYF80_058849 [Liparis tanakae]|uniref:Uncharacterized protein n=1 Tax=Liparis tanakae TaxID=230148 RepID=A0A4Z2EQ91_9TELE|nr:hypothetical protein EYF80_058849 [Liparis tanakae]
MRVADSPHPGGSAPRGSFSTGAPDGWGTNTQHSSVVPSCQQACMGQSELMVLSSAHSLMCEHTRVDVTGSCVEAAQHQQGGSLFSPAVWAMCVKNVKVEKRSGLDAVQASDQTAGRLLPRDSERRRPSGAPQGGGSMDIRVHSNQ